MIRSGKLALVSLAALAISATAALAQGRGPWSG